MHTLSQAACLFKFLEEAVYAFIPFPQGLVFCRGNHAMISGSPNVASVVALIQ